jgi:energy-coupling factor transport system permease protein
VLDPRTKLVAALAAAAVVVMTGPLPLAAGGLGLLLAAVLVLGFSRAYLRWLALVLPMALFFGGVTAWAVTVEAGLLAGVKLLCLTTVFFLFFSSRSSAARPGTSWTPSVPGGFPWSRGGRP